jgi:hypothetical protein
VNSWVFESETGSLHLVVTEGRAFNFAPGPACAPLECLCSELGFRSHLPLMWLVEMTDRAGVEVRSVGTWPFPKNPTKYSRSFDLESLTGSIFSFFHRSWLTYRRDFCRGRSNESRKVDSWANGCNLELNWRYLFLPSQLEIKHLQFKNKCLYDTSSPKQVPSTSNLSLHAMHRGLEWLYNLFPTRDYVQFTQAGYGRYKPPEPSTRRPFATGQRKGVCTPGWEIEKVERILVIEFQ